MSANYKNGGADLLTGNDQTPSKSLYDEADCIFDEFLRGCYCHAIGHHFRVSQFDDVYTLDAAASSTIAAQVKADKVMMLLNNRIIVVLSIPLSSRVLFSFIG
jgi:hypothetical protein